LPKILVFVLVFVHSYFFVTFNLLFLLLIQDGILKINACV